MTELKKFSEKTKKTFENEVLISQRLEIASSVRKINMKMLFIFGFKKYLIYNHRMIVHFTVV